MNEDYTYHTLDAAYAALQGRILIEGKSVKWQHTTPQIELLPDGRWRLRLIRRWTYRRAKPVGSRSTNVRC